MCLCVNIDDGWFAERMLVGLIFLDRFENTYCFRMEFAILNVFCIYRL